MFNLDRSKQTNTYVHTLRSHNRLIHMYTLRSHVSTVHSPLINEKILGHTQILVHIRKS